MSSITLSQLKLTTRERKLSRCFVILFLAITTGRNRRGKQRCGLALVQQTASTFPKAKIIQSQAEIVPVLFPPFFFCHLSQQKHTHFLSYQLSLGILLCFLHSIPAFLAKIVVFWDKEPKKKMVLLSVKICHDNGLVFELAFQDWGEERRGFKKKLISEVEIVKFIFKDVGLGLICFIY